MEPLLQPLLESPGDPAVLRVLSDALQEQGDPWGEAIQLALDLESTFPGEDAHRLGHRRLDRLQLRYGSIWRARLRKPAPQTARAMVGLFRGIPSKVNSADSQVIRLLDGPIASLDYTDGANSLVPAWPRRGGLVHIEVGLNANPINAQKLLGPGLKSLRSISLPWRGEETVSLLEVSDWTRQLERLRLYGFETMVTPPLLERLLALALPKLRALELQGLQLGLTGADRLTAIKWKLERLGLAGANLGVKGIVLLASSPALATVKELSLARNSMGPLGAVALATSPHLKQLISLDLTSTASGVKTLAPFYEALTLPSLKGKGLEPFGKAKSKALAQLTELDLAGNLMGDEGLVALSKTTALSGVRVLQLAGNAIKGPGLEALGKSVLLSKVEELTLSHNKFQNTGAKGLGASKKLGSLEVLTLGHNWLGVQGLKAILKNPSLTRLQHVREGMNNYGPELARSFTGSKNLKLWTLGLGPETTTDVLSDLLGAPQLGTLELFSLQCHAFDDALAEVLIRGPLAKSATTVYVSRAWCNQLTDAGVQKLTSVLGPRVSFD